MRPTSRWLNLLVYLFIIACLVLYFKNGYSSLSYGPDTKSNVLLPYSQDQKKVLIYAATKFFTEPITSQRFLAHCPEKREFCRISEDFQHFSKADAVVFHNADYNQEAQINVLSHRNPKIPYVLWSLESPSNDVFRPGKDIINWTMTYRTDADIWAPYGHIEKKSDSSTEKRLTEIFLRKKIYNIFFSLEMDLEAIWSSKTLKKTTFLVSNCFARNRRMEIVKNMKNNGMEIDIWGSCGSPPPKCNGVNKQGDNCVVELIRPYLFYISIENSNCKDYVTEKFWQSLGERMVVPIVLTRKYYRDLGVPDSAYISVDDFSNISELVAHIKELSENKELYLKYHEWRKTWRIVIGEGFSGFCRLCDKLQNAPEKWPEKNYGNPAAWHQIGGNCQNSIGDKFIV
ncbi:unnamed protein product [Caenorhabditis angaria]|uniref:Fucosyltransferase n=1 Tax=Caenorhabditis angaria TaxID=860376 RepID=A0A9P1IDC1_9PELO|nr:unnamed protein product [Caenorhabditis angaria]